MDGAQSQAVVGAARTRGVSMATARAHRSVQNSARAAERAATPPIPPPPPARAARARPPALSTAPRSQQHSPLARATRCLTTRTHQQLNRRRRDHRVLAARLLGVRLLLLLLLHAHSSGGPHHLSLDAEGKRRSTACARRVYFLHETERQRLTLIPFFFTSRLSSSCGKVVFNRRTLRRLAAPRSPTVTFRKVVLRQSQTRASPAWHANHDDVRFPSSGFHVYLVE